MVTVCKEDSTAPSITPNLAVMVVITTWQLSFATMVQGWVTYNSGGEGGVEK